MRDITKIIGFLIREVVPAGEPIVADLERISHKASYTAPEMQGGLWAEFCFMLDAKLGDPAGTPWKERVAAIVGDTEKVA